MAHLESVRLNHAHYVIQDYGDMPDINPLHRVRLSKEFERNQWHQDVADGKIDPLASMKRDDATIGFIGGSIALAAMVALWCTSAFSEWCLNRSGGCYSPSISHTWHCASSVALSGECSASIRSSSWNTRRTEQPGLILTREQPGSSRAFSFLRSF